MKLSIDKIKLSICFVHIYIWNKLLSLEIEKNEAINNIEIFYMDKIQDVDKINFENIKM